MADEFTPHFGGPWGCGLEGADPGMDGPAVATWLSEYLGLFRNVNHPPAPALPDLAFHQVSGAGPRSWERVGGCAESGTGLVSGSVSQCLYLSSFSVSHSQFLCFSVHLPSSVHLFYSQHLFSICLFLSLHLPLFAFTLISLSVLPCLLPLCLSVSGVGLPVSLSLSRNLVTGRGCRAKCWLHRQQGYGGVQKAGPSQTPPHPIPLCQAL